MQCGCTCIVYSLYRERGDHEWGGPDANTGRLKQSISAVRASGGFPGNVGHMMPISVEKVTREILL